MKRAKKLSISIPKSIEPVRHRYSRPVYDSNPYLQNLKVFVSSDVKIVAKDIEIRDKSKEDIDAGVIGVVKNVDNEEFIKVYTANMSVIFNLPHEGQQALSAVFYAVQKQAINTDKIFLPYKLAKQYYNIFTPEKFPDKSAFSRGIKILIDVGFIALADDGNSFYWINPALIFNGDRITFIEQYNRKAKEKEINDNKAKFNLINSNSVTEIKSED